MGKRAKPQPGTVVNLFCFFLPLVRAITIKFAAKVLGLAAKFAVQAVNWFIVYFVAVVAGGFNNGAYGPNKQVQAKQAGYCKKIRVHLKFLHGFRL